MRSTLGAQSNQFQFLFWFYVKKIFSNKSSLFVSCRLFIFLNKSAWNNSIDRRLCNPNGIRTASEDFQCVFSTKISSTWLAKKKTTNNQNQLLQNINYVWCGGMSWIYTRKNPKQCANIAKWKNEKRNDSRCSFVSILSIVYNLHINTPASALKSTIRSMAVRGINWLHIIWMLTEWKRETQ